MANILVTGASRGIGLEFVKQLAIDAKPAKILALCRNPPKAEELKALASKHSTIAIIKADLTDFDKYDELVGKVKKNLNNEGLHLLINNAGYLVRDTLETVTAENVIRTHEINTVAPLMLTKALVPLLSKADPMKALGKSGNSTVVTVTSQLGSIGETSTSGMLSYRMSKAGVNMATRSLALDLKPMNIFVLALHPGWVKTDMGGPKAPISVEDSVAGMLKTTFVADESARGNMLGYNGRAIPW